MPSPENLAACPSDKLSSRYSAVAIARRIPGAESSDSSSRCTSSASGRCRFRTMTGCSRASRSAADGLFFSSRTLTAFILPSTSRWYQTRRDQSPNKGLQPAARRPTMHC